MKILFRCLAVAIATAAFLAFVQRSRISTARTELERLQTNGVLPPSKMPRPSAPSPAAAEDIQRLRAENRDIHKLRGQITEAREKRKEIERMQAENAQLRARIQNIQSSPPRNSGAAFPLQHQGQATPDAALETTFWSMYQGDIETLSRAMPMATIGLEKMPSEEKTNLITMMKVMASTVQKLEILDRKSTSPDETHLTVRITAPDGLSNSPLGPGKRTFVLRRTNDLWQVAAEHSE